MPLVGRESRAELFRTVDGAVTAAAFLAGAHRLASALPAGAHVLNLCHDRYAFALAFAAALLRGQVSLMTSDRTLQSLKELGDRFPGLYAVSEDPAQGGAAV